MTYEQIYQSKLTTVEDAINSHIKDGDAVYISALSCAHLLAKEVVRKCKLKELTDIKFHGNMVTDDLGLDETLDPKNLTYYSFFHGPHERAAIKHNLIKFTPNHLSQFGNYMKSVSPDVSLVQMTPPDEHGYCNIGGTGYLPDALKYSKKIIAQINKNLPRVIGSCHDYHVSEIAAFVECDRDIFIPPIPEPNEIEKKIASYIIERIPDGACMQLGIGGTANAVGYGLVDKKHLGVHSEMFTDSLAFLQSKGVVDNSQKTFMPGISVTGFTFNTPLTNSFINKNPKVYFTPYSFVNDINNISANDNLISINTALSVDLMGQVASESIGFNQYSASGGQVDFVRGATLSNGGKSFIAIPSVANTKNGPVSKISLTLSPGTTVTTLRAEVMYIVTEYGCVNLQFVPIDERAKRLISIAHPDFRDELTFEAKKSGLIF